MSWHEPVAADAALITGGWQALTSTVPKRTARLSPKCLPTPASLRRCGQTDYRTATRARRPSAQLPIALHNRLLTAAEFQHLADVPPEREWCANLTNVHTKRAYEDAVGDFVRFTGIVRPEEFRSVIRAHVIAWRDDMTTRRTRRGQLVSQRCFSRKRGHRRNRFVNRCFANSGRGD